MIKNKTEAMVTLNDLDETLDYLARRYELSVYALRNDTELIWLIVNVGNPSQEVKDHITETYAKELSGEM